MRKFPCMVALPAVETRCFSRIGDPEAGPNTKLFNACLTKGFSVTEGKKMCDAWALGLEVKQGSPILSNGLILSESIFTQ